MFWVILGEMIFYLGVILLIAIVTTNTVNQLGGLNGLNYMSFNCFNRPDVCFRFRVCFIFR